MRTSHDPSFLDLVKLAIPAGSFAFAVLLVLALLDALWIGHLRLPLGWLAIGYVLCVALFIAAPVAIWLFFRVFSLFGERRLRRKMGLS